MFTPNRSILYPALSAIIVLVGVGCGDTSASLEGSPGMGTVSVQLSLVAWESAGSPDVERFDFVVASRDNEILTGSTAGPEADGPLVWEATLDLESGDYVISFALFDRLGELLCWADEQFIVAAAEDTPLVEIPLVCIL